MAYNNYSIDDIAARKSYVSYNGKSLGDITIAVSGIPRPVDLTQAIVFDSSLHISDMGQNLSYCFIGTSSIDTSSVDIYTTYVPQPIALAYTTSIYRYDSSYGQFENMSQLYGIFLSSNFNTITTGHPFCAGCINLKVIQIPNECGTSLNSTDFSGCTMLKNSSSHGTLYQSSSTTLPTTATYNDLMYFFDLSSNPSGNGFYLDPSLVIDPSYGNYTLDKIVNRSSDVSFNGRSLGDITVAYNNIIYGTMGSSRPSFLASQKIQGYSSFLYYFMGTTTIDSSLVDIYTTSTQITGIPRFSDPTGQFAGVGKLRGIFLSSNITDISDNFCASCSNLQAIEIPNECAASLNVTHFSSCAKLKTNSLPYKGTLYAPSSASTALTDFFSTTNGFYLNSPFVIDPSYNNNYLLDQIVNRSSDISCNGRSWGDITIAVPNSVSRSSFLASPKYMFNSSYSYYFMGTSSIDSSSVDIYTTYSPTITSILQYTPFTNTNQYNQLYSLFLSNNVTSINPNVFNNNHILKYIHIPNSVASIDPTAFTGCTILKTNSSPYPGTIYTSAPPTEYIINFFNSNDFYLNFSPLLCFKEGSKILYYNRETNQEQYIEIEKLKRGDLVKTLLHGYKKIEHIGNSKMYNNVNNIRSVDKLYKCSKTEYPELFEDLIITGAHSILVNDFKDNEKEKTLELLSDIYVTDKKYRLPACIDKRAQIYEIEGQHTIWHFSLEHENYYMNYGVFANGLLVETASNRMMIECSGLNIL